VFAPGIEDTFSHGCIFSRCFGFAAVWLLHSTVLGMKRDRYRLHKSLMTSVLD
jgi:hypothetical protein